MANTTLRVHKIKSTPARAMPALGMGTLGIWMHRGYGLMVNSLSSTQMIRVRFPLPAAYLVKLVYTTDLKSVPNYGVSVQVR